MLPDKAYPGPLPLNRKAALEVLSHLDEFDIAGSTFLVFVEIEVEARIGEWRFAGASTSLTTAVLRVERFAVAMGMSDAKPLLRQLLEDHENEGYDNGFSYPRKALWAVDCPHRLVLCVRSGAPLEGFGVGIVEVEDLEDSGYEGVDPETHPPEPEDNEDEGE